MSSRKGVFLVRIALVELASVDYLNVYAPIKMPRGIQLLAAILEQSGHSVDCFAETVQKFKWSELTTYDMVGFSAISCTARPTYAMIRKLKNAGYQGTIVVGGPHATAWPHESLDAGADVVVRHEGDKTLPQLIGAIERKEGLEGVSGISWRKKGETKHNSDQTLLAEEELSELPLPAFKTIRGFQKMRQISVTFSRGCPFACDFCAVEAMFGPKYRFASTDWRIAQLRDLRTQYPEIWQNCAIFFADDNFFGSKRGQTITLEMLKRMIVEDLIPPKGWFCQMRVTDAISEVARLMKQAGCKMVCLGIESVDADTLKAFGKGQTPEQIKKGLENLHEAGIETLPMTIAGADTDTFWSFFSGIRQLARWGVTYLQIAIMVPLPDTKMTARFIANKRRFSQNLDRYNGMHVLLKPKKMSKIGVWMALYLVTIWFYFISSNGRRLFKKHFRFYLKMIKATFLQVLKEPWQAIKERFVSD